MKPITSFEIIYHGVEHSQYFQGCGVSHTPYTDVATGIGSTPKEALDDALDSLAQNDWDIEPIDQSDEYVEMDDTVPIQLASAQLEDECEMYCYVSVRVASNPSL